MNRTAQKLGFFLSMSLVAASCADDGYNDNESWSTNVKNSQLINPAEVTYTKTSTSDTEKTIVFTWNVVHGAGGYLISLTDVSNPAQPVSVVADSLIDRCSVAFILPNEFNYELSLRTIGNKALGNKDAAEPLIKAFDTFVPSKLVPAGAEISAWLADNLEDSDVEQGVSLEAGATYTLKGFADFRLNNVELRGDKNNAPTIVVSDTGCFITQGGLKIRDLNIDCSEAGRTGLLNLSETPDESLSTEALGYKALGANQDGFVIQDPVVFQNCKIKNLPKSLLFGNKKNWTLLDFRIVNCIIQMKTETSTHPVINLTGASNGLIQKLCIDHSTIYNTLRNENECYFIRFSNQSNSQPKKILGDINNILEWNISSSSFIRTNLKKDFANNLPNTQNGDKLWIKMTDCVFFDVYKIYQIIQTQWIKTTTNNFSSYSICEPSPTDYGPTGRTDQFGNFYTTLDETPEFDDSQLQELDFSKDNGGVNLAPSGLAAKAQSGDPRWY